MPSITLLHPGPSTPPPPSLPHILLVVDQLPHRLGGGERIVLRQAQHLPAFGYRASILTFAAHPESPALHNPPCPIYLLPLTRTWDLRALRGSLALRRFLRRERVRLVETFFESSDIWAGAVARLLSPARLVWNRRDMGILRSPKHFAAYRRLRRLPHHVFAVSAEVARYTTEVDGVPPDRITVVHNGLDLAAWQHLTSTPPPPDRPRIVTLGNLRRIKGHDTLLHAFAQVLKEFPEATLEIGGGTLEPDFLAELHQIIVDHGLTAATLPFTSSDSSEASPTPQPSAQLPGSTETPTPQPNVLFRGSIDGVAAQQAFLARATLFVLPSRSEGFSNAIIEAMAAGLPVIATRVGGNPEAVLDTTTAPLASTPPVNLAKPISRTKPNQENNWIAKGNNGIGKENNGIAEPTGEVEQETGLLIPPDDPAALTQALLTLLRNPTRMARMSTNARTRVATHFTTEAMLHTTTQTFHHLLSEALT